MINIIYFNNKNVIWIKKIQKRFEVVPELMT